ncbi:MAG: ribosome maturation factor RimM [Alphaproteobacteria bacterium]
MTEDRKICVGKIMGAHGLRGLVRLRSFTENPAAIAQYALTDQNGRTRHVTLRTPMGEEFIAELDGVNDRVAAESAKGLQLFMNRDELPATGVREYYLADLVGLRVDDATGQPCGTVHALHNFGAGSILEIKLPDGRTAMLPFRDAFVPTVDVAQGRVVIVPPPDWLDTPTAENKKQAGKGKAP